MSALAGTVVQTQREVWDVLNAGPLQRFTANGRLVHNCLILDHSDTTLRLGFVTDIHYETLDDGSEPAKKKASEPLPKECPSCAYLKPPRTSVCPNCGFKPEVKNTVEAGDGELVELTGKQGKQKISRDEKQRWYSMLIRMAVDRGYRRGWVAGTYRDKFGVWPNGLSETVADYVDYDVANYVKSRLIAYARGKEARNGR
jgi:hypothetical protein